MADSQFDATLRLAFENDSQLLNQVRNAASDGTFAPLLFDIASYINKLRHTLLSTTDVTEREYTTINNGISSGGQPASKKRRIDDAGLDIQGAKAGNGSATTWINEAAAFVAPDVSFAVPVRKKLKVEVVSGVHGEGGIRGIDIKTGDVEIAVAWKDIDQIICVPVPEKATPASHFVIITTPSSATSTTDSPTHEPIVFTIPSTVAKMTTFSGVDFLEGETLDGLMRRVLNHELQRAKGQNTRVVVPDAREFVSGVVQAHRKGEKAWHVKAWRGSKDGYLYFLSTGILSGFRKPLSFYPFHAISSISYSSILQRTFNLNISTTATSSDSIAQTNPSNDNEETTDEFSMLDQADFAGIDAYIKRHGLNDASLAAGRRAKFYNVNPSGGVGRERRNGASNGAVRHGSGVEAGTELGDEGDGEGEDDMVRAERALQDAEDAEEEDYDPSSGESEGSGSDSENEGEGDNGDAGDDGDLGEELDTDEEAELEEGGYEDDGEGAL